MTLKTKKGEAVLEAAVLDRKADLEVAHGLHVNEGHVRVHQDEAEDHEAVVEAEVGLIRQDVGAAIATAIGLLKIKETAKRGTDSMLLI